MRRAPDGQGRGDRLLRPVHPERPWAGGSDVHLDGSAERGDVLRVRYDAYEHEAAEIGAPSWIHAIGYTSGGLILLGIGIPLFAPLHSFVNKPQYNKRRLAPGCLIGVVSIGAGCLGVVVTFIGALVFL